MMNLNEENAFLKAEIIHERKLTRQARRVALDLADILSQVMGDVPEDLQEVFDQWEKAEKKAQRAGKKGQR